MQLTVQRPAALDDVTRSQQPSRPTGVFGVVATASGRTGHECLHSDDRCRHSGFTGLGIGVCRGECLASVDRLAAAFSSAPMVMTVLLLIAMQWHDSRMLQDGAEDGLLRLLPSRLCCALDVWMSAPPLLLSMER